MLSYCLCAGRPPHICRLADAYGKIMLLRCSGLLCSLGLARGFHVSILVPSRSSLLPMRSTAVPGVGVGASSPRVYRHEHDEVTENEEDVLFDWNKQWYPVLSLADTDPGRAHAVQVLGKDLVVWRDAQKRWTCFDDRCPHRAAPFTEGRLEKDGSLLCAYHGWTFDATGKCLNIPQSVRGGKDEAQTAACTKVYPTQVAQDVIWIWAENGPDAALESALKQPALVPELSGVEGWKVTVASPSHRDLPYGWDTFMENVVDPSHVPVSHHGIAGDRYKDNIPVPLQQFEQGSVSKNGFGFINNAPISGKDTKIFFIPPALVINEVTEQDGSKLKLILYGVPTRPGWCRLIGRQFVLEPDNPGNKNAKKGPTVAAGLVAVKVPSWLAHVLGSLFLHQDLVFLHHQEKILAAAGHDSSNYGQAVYTPTSADKGVLALRKWITKYGSGGPAWDKSCNPALPAREHNREVLFNVYEQHTKKCSTCMTALKRVKKALSAAKASTVVSLAWAVLQGARGFSTAASPCTSAMNAVVVRTMLPGLAATLVSLGTFKALEKLHGMFYTYPFHHQDN